MQVKITQMQQSMQARISELTTMLNHANTAKAEMMRMESERHNIQDDMMVKNAELNAQIDEMNKQIAK